MTFTYRKVGSNRRRKMTLDAMEFLRRFLQHVLPSGFQKVRSYGFLSPAGAVALELVRWLIALSHGSTVRAVAQRGDKPVSPPAVSCPACGGRAGAAGVRAGRGARDLRHELAR